MVLHNLGGRLREERQSMRMTQERLAELAGCNDSYIGQVERGTKNPSLEMLVNIAKALGVTLDYLLNDNMSFAVDSGLTSELVGLLKGRSSEDVRLVLQMTRMLFEHLDKSKL